MTVEVTILGCGSSGGVPLIGNIWGPCDPNDFRNTRRRVSILVKIKNKTFLIDTSPDLRMQMLDAKVKNIDAVLYTHSHADHVHGIDDLRAFCWQRKDNSGWRIAIIDSLDNLNQHGSNALLKILEEPPKKCLIFLISSNKSNVLDTIRSRSRILKFSELNHVDTKLIIQKNIIVQNELELQKVNLLAEGSPGKAIMLYNNNGLNIYDALIDLFNKTNEIDIKNIDPLLRDITNKKNMFGIKIISILITIYLNRAFRRSLKLIKLDISKTEKESQENFLQYFNIADIPSLWENISTHINLSLRYNLDKKQTLITIIEKLKNLKKNNEVLKGN